MAQHRYFVRKDPASIKVEWLEMNGLEFYSFIKSSENADRHFANMGDFTIEMPTDQYESWERDRKRCAYLNYFENGVTFLSLQEQYQPESGCLEERIHDPAADVERDVISSIERKSLLSAVQALDQESRYIIEALFLSNSNKTESDLAKELGVTQQRINRRKKKILENLKILVVKSQKNR